MKKKTHMVGWTDTRGNKFSIIADFATAVALSDALASAIKGWAKSDDEKKARPVCVVFGSKK